MKNLGTSSVVRSALVTQGHFLCELSKVTLDTGASNGNYIGYKVIVRSGFDERKMKSCNHKVRLGATELIINNTIKLNISMYDDNDKIHTFNNLQFYVVESLGDEAIIGLQDLLGQLFQYFIGILITANENNKYIRNYAIDEMNMIVTK